MLSIVARFDRESRPFFSLFFFTNYRSEWVTIVIRMLEFLIDFSRKLRITELSFDSLRTLGNLVGRSGVRLVNRMFITETRLFRFKKFKLRFVRFFPPSYRIVAQCLCYEKSNVVETRFRKIFYKIRVSYSKILQKRRRKSLLKSGTEKLI